MTTSLSSTTNSVFDVVLGVPSDCSGRFAGCQLMPAALREAGLIESLGVEDRGNVQVAIADPRRDPATGVVGLALSLLVSRLLGDLLVGTRPTDLMAFVGAPLVLGATAVLALYMPARRASRAEPMSVFRRHI